MREKQCKKCGKYFRPEKSMKQIYCKTCTNKKKILAFIKLSDYDIWQERERHNESKNS